jgi:chemotaxis protein histidine kinase CheA
LTIQSLLFVSFFLSSTATAEGRTMAQVLSTFSRLEQSRFEAFRRATFCGDAISRYIAQCMIQTQEQRYGLAALPPPPAAVGATESVMTTHPSDSLNNDRRAAGATTTTRTLQQPPLLEHLCAPDHAEEITIVVSTLAKSYAQRLVTAARRAATDDTRILPKHILQVYRERQASGLDPGFFLQPPPLRAMTVPTSTAEGQAKYNLRRLAALGLQDEYDKQQQKQQEAAAAAAAAKKEEEEKERAKAKEEEEKAATAVAAAAPAKKDEEEEKERAKANEEEGEKVEKEQAQEANQQQQQNEVQQNLVQQEDAKSPPKGEENQQTDDAKEESTNKEAVEAPTPMELELDDPTAL